MCNMVEHISHVQHGGAHQPCATWWSTSAMCNMVEHIIQGHLFNPAFPLPAPPPSPSPPLGRLPHGCACHQLQPDDRAGAH